MFSFSLAYGQAITVSFGVKEKFFKHLAAAGEPPLLVLATDEASSAGANVIKPFMAVSYDFNNKLER